MYIFLGHSHNINNPVSNILEKIHLLFNKYFPTQEGNVSHSSVYFYFSDLNNETCGTTSIQMPGEWRDGKKIIYRNHLEHIFVLYSEFQRNKYVLYVKQTTSKQKLCCHPATLKLSSKCHRTKAMDHCQHCWH